VQVGNIEVMTTPATADQAAGTTRRISVLIYSSDRTTRDAVRLGVGTAPGPGVEVGRWLECATAPAVEEAVREGGWDVLILDGEARPYGGMGLCRQFKTEIYDCPQIVVLTMRPDDAWLAAWSLADGVVPHPLDPATLAAAVTRVATSA
jgi:DNA-binding response OmpR family regulator